jgi:hypothetical protein
MESSSWCNLAATARLSYVAALTGRNFSLYLFTRGAAPG